MIEYKLVGGGFDYFELIDTIRTSFEFLSGNSVIKFNRLKLIISETRAYFNLNDTLRITVFHFQQIFIKLLKIIYKIEVVKPS